MLSLSALIRQARDSPLYRDWPLSGVQRFGDPSWRQLPTLHRDALKRLSLPAPGDKGELLFISTGTTGSPKLIRYGSDDLDRVADLCARFGRLEGVTGHSRVMVLLPMGLWPVGRITVAGHRRLGAQVFPVDLHGGIHTWERMAREIRPTVISSTPSVLVDWASSHYEGPRLELLETTGEPLMSRERHLIEGAFGGLVYDAYGLTECVVGVECAIRDGFHFWPDATGVEILAPERDQSLEPGKIGELVLTSFQQATQPILRYRSGDLGRLEPQPCPCGHPSPLVRLKGRLRPGLSLPRGVLLENAVLEQALTEQGVEGWLRYKASPESPAAPFLAARFHPTLEVIYHGESPADQVRAQLLAALPELAELCHEGDIRLDILRDQGTGRH